MKHVRTYFTLWLCALTAFSPTTALLAAGPAAEICQRHWSLIKHALPNDEEEGNTWKYAKAQLQSLLAEVKKKEGIERENRRLNLVPPPDTSLIHDVADGVLWNLHIGGDLRDQKSLSLEDLISLRQRLQRLLETMEHDGSISVAHVVGKEDIEKLLKDPKYAREKFDEKTRLKICAGLGGAVGGVAGLIAAIETYRSPNAKLEKSIVDEARKTTAKDLLEHIGKTREIMTSFYEKQYDRDYSYRSSGTADERAKTKKDWVKYKVDAFVIKHQQNLEKDIKSGFNPTFNARFFRYDELRDNLSSSYSDYDIEYKLKDLIKKNDEISESCLRAEYKEMATRSSAIFTPAELEKRKNEGDDSSTGNWWRAPGLFVGTAGVGALGAFMGCDRFDKKRIAEFNRTHQVPKEFDDFKNFGSGDAADKRELFWVASNAHQGGDHTDVIMQIQQRNGQPVVSLTGVRYKTTYDYRVDEVKLAAEKARKEAAGQSASTAETNWRTAESSQKTLAGIAEEAKRLAEQATQHAKIARDNDFADQKAAAKANAEIKAKLAAVQRAKETLDHALKEIAEAATAARAKANTDPATDPKTDVDAKNALGRTTKPLAEAQAAEIEASKALADAKAALKELTAIAAVTAPPPRPPGMKGDATKVLTDMKRNFINRYFGDKFGDDLQPIHSVFDKAIEMKFDEVELLRFFQEADPQASGKFTRDIKSLEELENLLKRIQKDRDDKKNPPGPR